MLIFLAAPLSHYTFLCASHQMSMENRDGGHGQLGLWLGSRDVVDTLHERRIIHLEKGCQVHFSYFRRGNIFCEACFLPGYGLIAENQLYFTSSSKSIHKTTNVPGEDHTTPFCWPLSIQDAGWPDKADIHRLNQVVRQTSRPIFWSTTYKLSHLLICPFRVQPSGLHISKCLSFFLIRNEMASQLT